MLAASDDPSVPESKKLSDTEVLAQSFVFLAAGYETSSTTLSFVCHHLATSPEIQEKLQQEIDNAWPDEDQMLSYETLHELPYLDMVISEALRMYPPGRRGDCRSVYQRHPRSRVGQYPRLPLYRYSVNTQLTPLLTLDQHLH